MEELVIKVPAPFSGVDDLGFSARYPAQEPTEPLRDVPLFVEGPARPMRVLVERLALLAEKERLLSLATSAAEDEAYTWTPPIQLSDEVCVLAFRDRSMRAGEVAAAAGRQYLWNLVRPMAFTFLRDCVRIGGLRLADRIAVVLDAGQPPVIDLELDRSSIWPQNGTLLLGA
ncbi:MAG TPA: hypothetical protein VFC09_04975 [Candidatus Dormibacteraeota bacterium]|nr:hypothetical protein [Candidatus Dormibacteraeota bacterium]